MYNLNIKEVLKTMTVTVLYSHNKLQKISIFLKLKILAEHVDAKDCLYNKKNRLYITVQKSGKSF